MTAEVAILNPSAVALAADSAATVPGERAKVYNSANKVFALSKYHPVGIMVYGNSEFMGIPWETIIKTYRSDLRSQSFDTLREYADHFMAHIMETVSALVPADEIDRFIRGVSSSFLEYIQDRIYRICATDFGGGHWSSRRLKHIADTVVQEEFGRWSDMPFAAGFDPSSVRKVRALHREALQEELGRTVGRGTIYAKTRTRLIQLLALVSLKDHPTPYLSGLVIAGFGREDIFPSLSSHLLDGMLLGRVKHKVNSRSSAEISFNNRVSIRAFAQSEMVNTFMEGIDPSYLRDERAWLSQTANKLPIMIADRLPNFTSNNREELLREARAVLAEFLRNFNTTFAEYRREQFSSRIVNVIGAMPKEELAAVAEALVSLTALKRKVSDDTESVGGPIDVAIISKGDGLVWIKRKHYFSSELNQHFLANYFREEL